MGSSQTNGVGEAEAPEKELNVKHEKQNASETSSTAAAVPATSQQEQAKTTTPVEQPQEPTFEGLLAKLTLAPKQQAALTGLLAEIKAKRTDDVKVTEPTMMDRKLVVRVNGARVAIGPGGGYEALDIRTYPKATVTFMASADLALAKQTGRDATKVAAAQAAVVEQAKANVAAAPVVEAAAEVAAR